MYSFLKKDCEAILFSLNSVNFILNRRKRAVYNAPILCFRNRREFVLRLRLLAGLVHFHNMTMKLRLFAYYAVKINSL